MPHTWRVALSIMEMTHGDSEVAMSYIRVRRRNKQQPDPCTTTELAERWAALSAVEHRLYSGQDSDPPTSVILAAQSFLREFKLQGWIGTQSQVKGLAPSPGLVLSSWLEAPSADDVTAAGASRPAATRRGKYQWLRRWCQRWRIHRGKFKTGPGLDSADMREKARATHFWILFGARPVSEVPKTSPNSGRKIKPTTHPYRIRGPNNGQHMVTIFYFIFCSATGLGVLAVEQFLRATVPGWENPPAHQFG